MGKTMAERENAWLWRNGEPRFLMHVYVYIYILIIYIYIFRLLYMVMFLVYRKHANMSCLDGCYRYSNVDVDISAYIHIICIILYYISIV